MSSDVFDKISERTRFVFSGQDRNGVENCIDEIINILRYKAGRSEISIFDFSCVLHELSLGIMISMGHLDDAEAFACLVRDAGEQTRKIITENWPPPNPEIWQWDPKRKGG